MEGGVLCGVEKGVVGVAIRPALVEELMVGVVGGDGESGGVGSEEIGGGCGGCGGDGRGRNCWCCGCGWKEWWCVGLKNG